MEISPCASSEPGNGFPTNQEGEQQLVILLWLPDWLRCWAVCHDLLPGSVAHLPPALQVRGSLILAVGGGGIKLPSSEQFWNAQG